MKVSVLAINILIHCICGNFCDNWLSYGRFVLIGNSAVVAPAVS